MVNRDALWKGIIEDLVEEFIHFFFSNFVSNIDLEQGFDFLDKELSQLAPQSESKLRHADSLFKAWLQNGEEQWFLVHVEVQGYADSNFAKRMYQYAYRIRDRFDKPITAMAIYTDSNPAYHFSQYRETFMGTEVVYRFHTYVLMEQDPVDLRKSGNLFGLVMEVAYQEMEHKKKSVVQRFNFATDLIRHLLNQGIDKLRIKQLLDFITCYVRFDQDEFFSKFEREIQLITKSRQAMGIREAILHDVKQTGFEEGQAKGIQQGIEQGIEQGMEKGIEKGKEEKERIFVQRSWEKGLTVEEIAELADITKEKAMQIIEKWREAKNETEVIEVVTSPVSISDPELIPEEQEKKHQAIIHAWQRGLSLDEIAELANLSIEEVELIIQEYSKME